MCPGRLNALGVDAGLDQAEEVPLLLVEAEDALDVVQGDVVGWEFVVGKFTDQSTPFA